MYAYPEATRHQTSTGRINSNTPGESWPPDAIELRQEQTVELIENCLTGDRLHDLDERQEQGNRDDHYKKG